MIIAIRTFHHEKRYLMLFVTMTIAYNGSHQKSYRYYVFNHMSFLKIIFREHLSIKDST